MLKGYIDQSLLNGECIFEKIQISQKWISQKLLPRSQNDITKSQKEHHKESKRATVKNQK